MRCNIAGAIFSRSFLMMMSDLLLYIQSNIPRVSDDLASASGYSFGYIYTTRIGLSNKHLIGKFVNRVHEKSNKCQLTVDK